MVGDVIRKGQILVAGGAAVRGRVRRLDRYPEGGYFAVGLEFTEIETNDGPLRFYADLLRMDKRPGIQAELSEHAIVRRTSGPFHDANEKVTLPELPGVASFFIHGEKFTLPAGFRTVWRTRGPIR